MTHRSKLIQAHDRQLTRPHVGINLSNGSILCDNRLSMLLHLVDDTRSVLDACSLMQMSYSAAWKMLNQVEDAIGYPLVRHPGRFRRQRHGADGKGQNADGGIGPLCRASEQTSPGTVSAPFLRSFRLTGEIRLEDGTGKHPVRMEKRSGSTHKPHGGHLLHCRPRFLAGCANQETEEAQNQF